MVNGIGRAIDGMINGMMVLIAVFVPLGIWKMIDIIVFIFKHISVVAK